MPYPLITSVAYYINSKIKGSSYALNLSKIDYAYYPYDILSLVAYSKIIRKIFIYYYISKKKWIKYCRCLQNIMHNSINNSQESIGTTITLRMNGEYNLSTINLG